MTQVTQHLKTHGVPFEHIAHQQAYTSIAEARTLGIDASEVLKTVAMRVAGGYALMAVPATCRLDMHLVQAAVGDRHVRLATEEELRRDFPDIELGALPPLGSLLGAPLYVDQEVLPHETVVISARGTCRSVALQGMRPQSPADRRIWSVPCRGALPRGTNLRAGRSTTGNATYAEEEMPPTQKKTSVAEAPELAVLRRSAATNSTSTRYDYSVDRSSSLYRCCL